MTVVRGGELPGDFEESVDTVVVGSGAGGAVVAAHLAEAGQRVLVIEEGPHVPPETTARLRPSESLRLLWRDGGATAAFGLGGGPTINVTTGMAVGGSSLLTGAVCFRTPEAVLTEWARRFGLEGLAPERLAPCFDDVERAIHVEEVPVEARSRSTQLFAQGAARLGLPVLPLRRNTRGCRGHGRCNFGCPDRAKLSVDETYLPRARRAGAVVLSDARVTRVESDGARAVGVSGRLLSGPRRRPAGRLEVHARRVVVAAGALGTPGLIRRSGVGRRSGAAGRHLTLHPAFRTMARFDERVEGWNGAMQSAYCPGLEHERVNMVGLFVPPGVLAGTFPGIGDEQARLAALVPHLAVFGSMVHDDPGGRVHDLFGRPVMTYRLSARDDRAVTHALRAPAEIFFAAGAREVFLPILGLGPVGPDEFRRLDLARVPRSRLECTSQHPLGSCRMGVSADHAVFDGDGQSHELEELWVADGSAVPTSLGVNPQETIMALATRLAWHLRERPFAG